MQKFSILLLILLVSSSCNHNSKKEVAANEDHLVTTYYLIRHAEKDRSDSSNQDPQLNKEGVERAKRWSTYFSDIPLDAIYSTNYNRTRETASFTASDKKIQVQSYDPTDMYNEIFQNKTHGKTVLVVGHSNTTPQFVNAIIGENKYTDIDDSENGMLYIVIINGDEKKVTTKNIN